MNPSDEPKGVALPDATPGRPQWLEYPDGGTLARSFAKRIADQLADATAAQSGATLLVSGGRTPEALFAELSRLAIDWSAITVSLVDERFVDTDSPRSNAAMVMRQLLQGEAAAARFEPLYEPVATADEAAATATARLGDVPRPFDVVILGMGTDGHTASFFPRADRLSEALDPAGETRIVALAAPGAQEPRLSWTLPALVSARHLHLHIEGGEKKSVLFDALADPTSDAPIRSVFDHAGTPITIWYAST